MKVFQKFLFFGFVIAAVTSCSSHKIKKNSIVLGSNTTDSTYVVPKDSISLVKNPKVEKVFFSTQEIDFENNRNDDADKGAVLNARILWAF